MGDETALLKQRNIMMDGVKMDIDQHIEFNQSGMDKLTVGDRDDAVEVCMEEHEGGLFIRMDHR